MNVIVCIDNCNGMLFNQRRQSRDVKVRERILEICKGKTLWMSSYSSKLFADIGRQNVCVDDTFLDKVSKGEYCFDETQKLAEYEEDIEELIVFQWNKRYPADFYLDLELDSWKIIRCEDFEGFSHDKITEVRYKKDK